MAPMLCNHTKLCHYQLCKISKPFYQHKTEQRRYPQQRGPRETILQRAFAKIVYVGFLKKDYWCVIMMNVKINEGWLHNWVELHARVLTQRTISCAIIHNCHPIARLEVKLFFTVSHEILLGGQKIDMILNSSHRCENLSNY